MSYVLEARGLSRAFAGVQALQGVDLLLRAGEVHALMGQNGAGKSTLIKLLTGVHAADAGEVRLAGQVVRPAHPAAAQRLGISTVYQEVNLCPNLSVAENIHAGRYPRKGAAGLWRIDTRRMQTEARALLARLQLDVDVARPLASCSIAVQQMVAIARALAPGRSQDSRALAPGRSQDSRALAPGRSQDSRALAPRRSQDSRALAPGRSQDSRAPASGEAAPTRVLILDEPTSSLDEDEVQRLFTLLRTLRDDGLAILFVTHFLEQMYAISDRITVLRNGERVGEWLKAELPPAALIRAMVGRDLDAVAAREPGAAAAVTTDERPFVQARGLGRRGVLKPVDLALRRGEVLGVGGLLGSGRTELARLLFGLDRADTGDLALAGTLVKLTHPAQAIRQGLALCPEERKVDGIFAELSVRENILIALQARRGLWRHIGRARQDELASRFVQLLGVKTADIETPIGQLSGGNQQKCILARWLATEPLLLMLDEPTRGIDIAAKQDIMQRILTLAREGMAVLFISSEMDEVVRLSDRILVLRDRAKLGELPAGSSEHQVYQMIAS